MLNKLLLELQNQEKKLLITINSKNELLNSGEGKKIKEEFLRLQTLLEKDEERLHTNTAQQDIKNNEIRNLESEREDYLLDIENKDVSAKKQDKAVEQMEKLDNKSTAAKLQLVKLGEEEDSIDKQIIDTRKRKSFIKKKYTGVKSKKDEQLEKLKYDEQQCEEKIKQIKDQISSDILNIYMRIKKQHTNPICFVEDKKCCGCNMQLSSMIYEALKQTADIVRCESCGRILVLR